MYLFGMAAAAVLLVCPSALCVSHTTVVYRSPGPVGGVVGVGLVGVLCLPLLEALDEDRF